MKRIGIASAIAVVGVVGFLAAGGLQSDAQAGDHAGAFNVYDCTGAAKGQSLCYR